jgi:hypothetical protein
MAPSDRDKSTIGERLTGERDPKDPDGLLTVDDVPLDGDTTTEPAPAHSEAGEEYPTIPEHKGLTS